VEKEDKKDGNKLKITICRFLRNNNSTKMSSMIPVTRSNGGQGQAYFDPQEGAIMNIMDKFVGNTGDYNPFLGLQLLNPLAGQAGNSLTRVTRS